ncbi:hypothetical protein [Puniceicoccus vermicola]|uniref:Uncharacterized protein n=1 Tax=Puniceicoccus vermicola TaxID=388746 RepID=A0A7X1B013_9BACT|nr:hypothetical protein [Puniceicoccus vermicola]MBC2602068.1 hypothetical protein [Puniceicoccus vermicola]
MSELYDPILQLFEWIGENEGKEVPLRFECVCQFLFPALATYELDLPAELTDKFQKKFNLKKRKSRNRTKEARIIQLVGLLDRAIQKNEGEVPEPVLTTLKRLSGGRRLRCSYPGSCEG